MGEDGIEIESSPSYQGPKTMGILKRSKTEDPNSIFWSDPVGSRVHRREEIFFNGKQVNFINKKKIRLHNKADNNKQQEE